MVLKFIWTLPQNILGIILLIYFKSKRLIESQKKSGRIRNATIILIEAKAKFSGVSLGNWIFVSKSYDDLATVIKHEEGHCIQSMIFGPLYLFVIGIPSLIMNLMSSYSMKYGEGLFYDNYYKRWPENWADKLGNVDR